MERWQKKRSLHDTGKAEVNVTACDRKRVGRGEEVDDNGNAAPACTAQRDRDVEVGAGQVRQEDTPAGCETISAQTVKHKAGTSDCYDNGRIGSRVGSG